MPIFPRFLPIFFLGISLAYGEQLDCLFGIYMDFEYSCSLDSVNLKAEIDYEIRGTHNFGKTNDNVEILFVKNSNISTIPDQIYHEFPLQTLVITRSNLQGFNTGNCGYLEVIWAYSNELKIVPANSFVNCGKTVVLQLENNQIESIEIDAFTGLKNLRELTLFRNNLKTLDAQVFKGLKGLTLLSLQRNKIEILDNLIFQDLELLRSLDLGNNSVSIINKETFKTLKFLSNLYLDENKIERIQENIFDGKKFLQEISFRRNQISEINRGFFDFIQEPQEVAQITLDFSDNLCVNGTFDIPTGTQFDPTKFENCFK
jgi:Leucine-rich repeat (LRR) protein